MPRPVHNHDDPVTLARRAREEAARLAKLPIDERTGASDEGDLSRWLVARESSALVQSETASRDGTLRWQALGRAEAYRDVLDNLARFASGTVVPK